MKMIRERVERASYKVDEDAVAKAILERLLAGPLTANEIRR